GTLINSSSGTASFIVSNLQTKTLRAIAFKTGMANSNIKSADYSFERECGQGPSDPTKEETTVDDLLSLPEGMDPESLQTADRNGAKTISEIRDVKKCLCSESALIASIK